MAFFVRQGPTAKVNDFSSLGAASYLLAVVVGALTPYLLYRLLHTPAKPWYPTAKDRVRRVRVKAVWIAFHTMLFHSLGPSIWDNRRAADLLDARVNLFDDIERWTTAGELQKRLDDWVTALQSGGVHIRPSVIDRRPVFQTLTEEAIAGRVAGRIYPEDSPTDIFAHGCCDGVRVVIVVGGALCFCGFFFTLKFCVFAIALVS